LSNDSSLSTRELPPAEPDGAVWRTAPLAERPQPKLWKHVLLFFLTVATTTLTGAGHYQVFLSDFNTREVATSWVLLAHGFVYSFTILGILGAHEMGHYLACRWYRIDATLPYFLPFPSWTGTFGAVIRIREPFPTRTVLFDIGVAGPIAGFIVLVPALFYGLSLSTIVPEPARTDELIYLGEPLLFRGAAWLVFGTIADGYALNIHPIVFATWFGMLATAYNLLPFGQLDGGHITYATLGRWSTPISVATVATALLMTYVSTSWVVMTIIMLVMLVILGPRHPRVIYEYEPLGRGRHLVALFALVILVLCFTPVPLAFSE
jgi:membrane-associated protease RseP (regulator of RpoE activity)